MPKGSRAHGASLEACTDTHCYPLPAAAMLGEPLPLYHALLAAAELLLCLFPSTDSLSLACSAGSGTASRLGAGTDLSREVAGAGRVFGTRANTCRYTRCHV